MQTIVYIKPDVNWGSSKDALTYMSALNSTISLTEQKEHVKTYRPQILVLSGNPAHRQPLVDLANLITMENSLLVCANIITDPEVKETSDLKKAIEIWLKNHKIKAFYTSASGDSFSNNVASLINLTGLGKLSPNIVFIGYHQMKHNSSQTAEYFESVIKALEAQVAVAILRMPSGIHFSTISNSVSHDKLEDFKDVVGDMEIFRSGTKSGTIDVWWLFDDGGLTILIPYLISKRKQFKGCKIRLFALSENDLEETKQSLATLLSKFRIDVSEITMIPDITKDPKEATVEEFKSIIENHPDESITELIKQSNEQKTKRLLRTAELLREHSSKAELVVVTLPLPRRQNLTAVYYMAWLEIITRQMPPILLIRGNQTSVLTYYS